MSVRAVHQCSLLRVDQGCAKQNLLLFLLLLSSLVIWKTQKAQNECSLSSGGSTITSTGLEDTLVKATTNQG